MWLGRITYGSTSQPIIRQQRRVSDCLTASAGVGSVSSVAKKRGLSKASDSRLPYRSQVLCALAQSRAQAGTPRSSRILPHPKIIEGRASCKPCVSLMGFQRWKSVRDAFAREWVKCRRGLRVKRVRSGEPTSGPCAPPLFGPRCSPLCSNKDCGGTMDMTIR